MDAIEEKFKESSNLYIHRETLYYSLEGRKIELVTISSKDGIQQEREELIDGVFPEHHGD